MAEKQHKPERETNLDKVLQFLGRIGTRGSTMDDIRRGIYGQKTQDPVVLKRQKLTLAPAIRTLLDCGLAERIEMPNKASPGRPKYKYVITNKGRGIILKGPLPQRFEFNTIPYEDTKE